MYRTGLHWCLLNNRWFPATSLSPDNLREVFAIIINILYMRKLQNQFTFLKTQNLVLVEQELLFRLFLLEVPHLVWTGITGSLTKTQCFRHPQNLSLAFVIVQVRGSWCVGSCLSQWSSGLKSLLATKIHSNQKKDAEGQIHIHT